MTTCLPTSNNLAYMFHNLLGEVGELTEKICFYGTSEHDDVTAKVLAAHSRLAKTIRKEPDNENATVVANNINRHTDAIKKNIDIHKELGDILWQLSGVCSVLNLSLEDIAQQNLDKLASRKQRNQIDGNGDNR